MKKKMKKRCYVFAMLCMAVCMMMLVAPIQVQAASRKTKALQAYKEFLSKNIPWKGAYSFELDMITNYTLPEECQFTIAYIDNDSVPELVVYSDIAGHGDGYGRLYTYKNGKIKCIGKLDDDVYYYKKTGMYCTVFSQNGCQNAYYYKISGTKKQIKAYKITDDFYQTGKPKYSYKKIQKGKLKKTSKASFNKEMKQLTKSKKATKVKLYANTASNRDRILK